MADNTHMYREIRTALQEQIEAHLASLGEPVDVYPAPYQNIAMFPAVALELNRRRKPKVGVGVKQLELDMVVWIYTNILDAFDAEEECLRVLEIVEDAIENDKTLGGVVTYLDIDTDVNFGTVEQGEANFLQGAKMQVNIKKRFT